MFCSQEFSFVSPLYYFVHLLVKKNLKNNFQEKKDRHRHDDATGYLNYHLFNTALSFQSIYSVGSNTACSLSMPPCDAKSFRTAIEVFSFI